MSSHSLIHDRCSFSLLTVIAPDGRLDNMQVQTDPEPLRVVKPADQAVHYKQQVNVRFLEPPPPPEPAPIIIKVRSSAMNTSLEIEHSVGKYVLTV